MSTPPGASEPATGPLVDCHTHIFLPDMLGWTVLARDRSKRPCICELRRGKGAVLVINPAFDRVLHPKDAKTIGVPENVSRLLLRNLAAWVQ